MKQNKNILFTKTIFIHWCITIFKNLLNIIIVHYYFYDYYILLLLHLLLLLLLKHIITYYNHMINPPILP